MHQGRTAMQQGFAGVYRSARKISGERRTCEVCRKGNTSLSERSRSYIEKTLRGEKVSGKV
jgi:hypothetical protein